MVLGMVLGWFWDGFEIILGWFWDGFWEMLLMAPKNSFSPGIWSRASKSVPGMPPTPSIYFRIAGSGFGWGGFDFGLPIISLLTPDTLP